MIRKFTFGNPFPTEAVVASFPAESGELPYFSRERREASPMRCFPESLSTVSANRSGELISAAGLTPATARMIRTTWKPATLSTEPTISF